MSKHTTTLKDLEAILKRLERLARRHWIAGAYRDGVVIMAKHFGYEAAYHEAQRLLRKLTTPRLVKGN